MTFINTEDDAYWFGFLSADGSFGRSGKLKDGSPYFTGIACQLARKDEQHLYLMRDWLVNKGYTVSVKQLLSGQYKASRLRVNSVSLAKEFISLGWSGDKTEVLNRPNMPNELIRHFYRGLFDGDGSIQIRKVKLLLQAQMISSEPMLTTLVVDTKTIIKQDVKLYELSPKSQKRVKRLVLAGQFANQFLTWIYADCSIALVRKRDIWEAYNKLKA